MLNRHRGRGDSAAAETIKNTTMLFLLLFGAAASVLLWLFREPLLIMMGAEGEVLSLSAEYAAVIGLGAAVACLAVFGQDSFIIPAMGVILAALLLGRNRLCR